MEMKIRKFRKEMHLTQVELAERLGTTQRNISNWEIGARMPDLETMIRLADFFDVSVDELIGRTML